MPPCPLSHRFAVCSDCLLLVELFLVAPLLTTLYIADRRLYFFYLIRDIMIICCLNGLHNLEEWFGYNWDILVIWVMVWTYMLQNVFSFNAAFRHEQYALVCVLWHFFSYAKLQRPKLHCFSYFSIHTGIRWQVPSHCPWLLRSWYVFLWASTTFLHIICWQLCLPPLPQFSILGKSFLPHPSLCFLKCGHMLKMWSCKSCCRKNQSVTGTNSRSFAWFIVPNNSFTLGWALVKSISLSSPFL